MMRAISTFILAIFLAGALLLGGCNKDKESGEPCERIFDEWSKCASSEAVRTEKKLTRASFIGQCKKITAGKIKLPPCCFKKSNCAILEECVKGVLVVDVFSGAADALAPPKRDTTPKPKKNLGDFADE